VTHRPTALAGVNLVAVMIDGRLQAFGPKDEIMQRMTKHGPPPPTAESMACQTA
jgi:ABC-type protease/lipase transport system fused ATPase/permease subunit